jgi:tRNA-dihydrouridine synthase
MARCVEAMRQTTTLQVTMKHRIGIDDLDRYEDNVLPGCGSAASAGAPGGRQLR